MQQLASHSSRTRSARPATSYGCCTQVGLAGSADQIGSLPGNKDSADCSYWIDNKATVVPCLGLCRWHRLERLVPHRRLCRLPDHGCYGGKDIEGVWRKAFFEGPVTSQANGLPFQSLGVQLVN